ncbi:RNA polymerase sigma factor [bacterium]|nr:RNA polymerase sigma factor [bacterium]
MEDFEQVFRDNVSRIYRLSYQYLGNPDAAEDATQETFLRALRSEKDFRHSSEISTWLFRIAVNVCLDGIRQNKRRRMESLHSLPEPTVRYSAQEDLEKLDLQRRVRIAVNALPSQLRMLVVLREFEDLSYQEISSITGLSIGTISSRLNRARLQIARVFQNEFRRDL